MSACGPSASAQEALGVREVPIVNAYLLHFRAWATQRTGAAGASPLPPGKRCIVVLSHDVDSPIDPGSPRHAVELALANVRRGRKPARSIAYAAGTVGYAVRFRLRDPDARHQLFEAHHGRGGAQRLSEHVLLRGRLAVRPQR